MNKLKVFIPLTLVGGFIGVINPVQAVEVAPAPQISAPIKSLSPPAQQILDSKIKKISELEVKEPYVKEGPVWVKYSKAIPKKPAEIFVPNKDLSQSLNKLKPSN